MQSGSLSIQPSHTYRSLTTLWIKSEKNGHFGKPISYTLMIALFIYTLLATSVLAHANQTTTIRAQLEYLHDLSVIKSPVSTWPLTSAALNADLDACLEQQSRESIRVLCSQLKQSLTTQSNTTNVQAGSGNDTPLFGSFGAQALSQHALTLSSAFARQRLRGNLSISQVSETLDDDKTRFDGSYLEVLYGSWALGIGSKDRWWGPGWQSSLILSNNARPAPGLYLSRQNSTPFESPWLSWIGPWTLTTFMNQLEDERAVPNALMWGMRVEFHPTNNLQIGLSRTALWAGDGRPKDFDVFFDLLKGDDNFTADDPGKATEPGNQLGGIDIRYGFAIQPLTTAAFYTQVIGEDEAGGLPSRPMGLVGTSVSHALDRSHLTLFLEFSDTALDVFKADPIFNSAYEHGLYQTGYRYKGRSMGSQYDNDTRATTLGFQWNQHHQSIAIALSHLELNRDAFTSNGNVVSIGDENSLATEIRYWRQFHYFNLTTAAYLLSDLPENGYDVEHNNILTVGLSIPLN